MKALGAAIGVGVVSVAFLLIAVVDVLERLAPLLICLAIAWAAFSVIRARRRSSADDKRLLALWSPPPRIAAAPPSPPTAASPALNPHRERRYLVAGEDTGFASERPDGYLQVFGPALPPDPRPRPGAAQSARGAVGRSSPAGNETDEALTTPPDRPIATLLMPE